LHFKDDFSINDPLCIARKSAPLKLLLDCKQYELLAWFDTPAEDAVVYSGESEKLLALEFLSILIQHTADLRCSLNHDDAREQWSPWNMSGYPELIVTDIFDSDRLCA
jgi:hypothetical protein